MAVNCSGGTNLQSMPQQAIVSSIQTCKFAVLPLIPKEPARNPYHSDPIYLKMSTIQKAYKTAVKYELGSHGSHVVITLSCIRFLDSLFQIPTPSSQHEGSPWCQESEEFLFPEIRFWRTLVHGIWYFTNLTKLCWNMLKQCHIQND